MDVATSSTMEMIKYYLKKYKRVAIIIY